MKLFFLLNPFYLLFQNYYQKAIEKNIFN